MSTSRTEKSRKTPKKEFDRRDFRCALGQYATGVAVVTTRGRNGQRVGMTVNSFTSVSLDPPLILWCLAKDSEGFAEFTQASHFAVNVLAADQHDLSRKFAAQNADRFADVECADGPEGLPLLEGSTARFICRRATEIDAGDHIIFLGEVQQYEWHEGKPLVFHAGRYHVTTQHPDLPE